MNARLRARLTSRHNRNRNPQSRFRLVQLFILLLRCSGTQIERERGGGRQLKGGRAGEIEGRGEGYWCFLRKAALEMEYVCVPSGSIHSVSLSPMSCYFLSLCPHFAPFDLSFFFTSAHSFSPLLLPSSVTLSLLYLQISTLFLRLSVALYRCPPPPPGGPDHRMSRTIRVLKTEGVNLIQGHLDECSYC